MFTRDTINRETFDGIRVEIDGGIVYRGLYAINRKPLEPSEVALMAGVVGLIDAAEVPRAILLVRKFSTPQEVWAGLEPKPPKPKRPPRRGSIRSVRLNPMTGVIMVERW